MPRFGFISVRFANTAEAARHVLYSVTSCSPMLQGLVATPRCCPLLEFGDVVFERRAAPEPRADAHASVIADPEARYVPPRTGRNYYFCDFTVRLPGEPHFHDPFREWILDHHERMKRPEERIERFEVIVVEHDSPAPGTHEPTNVRSEVILRGARQPR